MAGVMPPGAILGFPSTLHVVTRRKLLLLDAALTLEELMVIELNPFLAGWLSC
jgi:hypothetical protein